MLQPETAFNSDDLPRPHAVGERAGVRGALHLDECRIRCADSAFPQPEALAEAPPHPDPLPLRGRGRTELPPPHLPKRGAPPGNANRLKHGRFTGAHIARRKEAMTLVRQTRALIRRLSSELPNAHRTV